MIIYFVECVIIDAHPVVLILCKVDVPKLNKIMI